MQRIVPCTRSGSRNPRRQPATALFSRLRYSPAQNPVKSLCDRGLWTLRLCTFDTRAVSCLPFVTISRVWLLSSPLPASTFATSSAQIENKFQDKEEFEQWLTAFGRHQVKNLCDRALWRHRLCTLDTRAVSCLPFVTLSRAWFFLRLCLPPPSPPALHKLKTSSRTRKNVNSDCVWLQRSREGS